MTGHRSISRSDAVTALVLTGVVLCSLSATGPAGRRRAREALCQYNLHQWSAVFDDYLQSNDGKFFTGEGFSGYYWIYGLDDKYRDRKKTRIWLCPEADKPLIDEDGKMSSDGPSIFSAWGIYTGLYYGPQGLAGSYGLNGYTVHVPEFASYESGVRASEGWRDFNAVPNADNVPLFVDALRFDMWPLHTDAPVEHPNAAWSSNSMARCCINRHNASVNCLFLDGSVRKVGLKELWTLKWHRQFDTAGPWTKAGGVTPSDWPEWMRGWKDY